MQCRSRIACTPRDFPQLSAVPRIFASSDRNPPDRLREMARLRLFASAREAARTGADAFDGATVADVLAAAEHRYGSGFSDVLSTCRIWVNGDAVDLDTAVGPNDEVAVLPPVSGGCT
jgi:molybdopterin converting factor small subunit